MGKAVDWQTDLFDRTSDLNITYFNPRRDDWDSSWVQEKTNPEFAEQVNWELDHLHRADYSVFVFDPQTQSPITLLELGMMVSLNNAFNSAGVIGVVCPTGYFRKGNVDILCARFGIDVFETIEELEANIRRTILRWSV